MAQQASGPAPSFRVLDLSSLCHKADSEMEKPEVVYEFSNKRKFESSDRSSTGVYEQS